MDRNEQMLNVPLKPEVKRLLEQQADGNGRAMGREAAQIIEREVMATAKRADA